MRWSAAIHRAFSRPRRNLDGLRDPLLAGALPRRLLDPANDVVLLARRKARERIEGSGVAQGAREILWHRLRDGRFVDAQLQGDALAEACGRLVTRGGVEAKAVPPAATWDDAGVRTLPFSETGKGSIAFKESVNDFCI